MINTLLLVPLWEPYPTKTFLNEENEHLLITFCIKKTKQNNNMGAMMLGATTEVLFLSGEV